MPKPKVSVIIPCYNHAKHLAGAFLSIKSQDLKGTIETIVVDDGSPDSDAIAQAVNDAEIPVILHRHEKNKGLAAARSSGVAIASASHVFMLDADNRLLPHCLRVLLAEIGDADAAYGIIRKIKQCQPDGLLSQAQWSPERLTRGSYIDAMALFKKETLQKYPYNEKLKEIRQGWEDYYLWLQLAQNEASVVFSPQIVAEYQVIEGSMISQDKEREVELARLFYSEFPSLVQQYPGNSFFGFPLSHLAS